MKEMTPQLMYELTAKIEGLVELELGQRLPFVCLLVTGGGKMAVFTNRSSNEETIIMMEDALQAVRKQTSDQWVSESDR